ncbi:MAG TPA: type I polyketide synthase, partial [Thermoanaerobaculia bacterium]
KVGFTTPSEVGQAEAILEAQAAARVEPETITYVETHGTATPIGDPIEMAALTRAFRTGTDGVGFCAVGSVKTNLGHLGSAAGVAGLLKAVMALEHREIPPSLNFETPNPAIDFVSSPFFVATELREWASAEDHPRRAGVSSFGLGGTNAHAVLEEAPERELPGPSRPFQPLFLSARTETALEALTDRLVEHLKAHPDEALADVAYTAATGRKAHEHRRVLVAGDRDDAIRSLASRDPRRVLGGTVRGGSDRPVAFVFSGLGEQYPGMAAELYAGEPVFRDELDGCIEMLTPLLGADLRPLLFPAAPAKAESPGGVDLRRMLGRTPSVASAELGPLDRTALLQPALFAVEYALARLWMAWGVQPQAMIGYSLGEYVAACLAGVLTLPDALRLVAERARLIDALPEGAMLAVPLPEEEARRWAASGAELSLAAVNAPGTSVIAGPVAAIEELEKRLAAEGLSGRRLRTTHAFHSSMLKPAAAPLSELARGFTLSPPRIPYLSNVTGTWITATQATDPEYWSKHLVRPVRFAKGVGELWREPGRVLLEVGPGHSLASLALQHPATADLPDPVALATLPSAYERQPEQAFVLGTYGKLWLSGVKVDRRALYAREERLRLALPTYPFERQRYWLQSGLQASAQPAQAAQLAADRGPASWLQLPAWRRSMPLPAPDLAAAQGYW